MSELYNDAKVAAPNEPKSPYWATIQMDTLENQRQTIDQLAKLERFLFGDGDDFDIPTPTCAEHALILTGSNAEIIRDRMQEILAHIGVTQQ